MRQLHAGHAVLDFLPLSWRQALARRMQEGVGLVVILAAALLGASLASWSIADPSLNHATGAPVRNLLGRPGAFLADPLMQALGLAGAALLAGALAAIPVTPRWPLPTGLGGFVGDGLLAFPIALARGLIGRSAGPVGGLVYGGAAV